MIKALYFVELVSGLTNRGSFQTVCWRNYCQQLSRRVPNQSEIQELLNRDSIRNPGNAFFVDSVGPHLEEHEESWRAFMCADNPTVFGKSANTTLIGHQDEKDPAGLNFRPLKTNRITFQQCLSSLQKHMSYFQKGTPQITDFEYDVLRRKTRYLLGQIRKRDPNFQGGLLTDGSSKIFEAYSIQDLASFFNSATKNRVAVDQQFCFRPIINGVPFHVNYLNGLIQNAVATGFGSKTVEVTRLIRAMSNVPTAISEKGIVTVSGYLLFDTKDFHWLNLHKRSFGQKYGIDTRSIIAHAILNQNTLNKALERKLKCYFDHYHSNATDFTKLSNVLNHLEEKGFPTMPRQYVVEGLWQDSWHIVNTLAKLPFESSGIEITINETNRHIEENSKTCHYKFIPTFRKTKVERIEFKVLPNGTVVAAIYVHPVVIAGNIANYFSINNVTHFEQQGICENSTIILSSYPNMLPNIFKSCEDMFLNGKSIFPVSCPRCDTVLTRIENNDAVIAFCTSELCCINPKLSLSLRSNRNGS